MIHAQVRDRAGAREADATESRGWRRRTRTRSGSISSASRRSGRRRRRRSSRPGWRRSRGDDGVPRGGAEKRRDTRPPAAGNDARDRGRARLRREGAERAGGPVRRGDDYHDVMDAMLRELHRRVASDAGARSRQALRGTGPLLERDLARRAGSVVRQDTNLINPERGSFFFRRAGARRRAGDGRAVRGGPLRTCTRCIEACPTRRSRRRELDARRCISYLTIELREEIPVELRRGSGIGLWVRRVPGCVSVERAVRAASCPSSPFGRVRRSPEGCPSARARTTRDDAGGVPRARSRTRR